MGLVQTSSFKLCRSVLYPRYLMGLVVESIVIVTTFDFEFFGGSFHFESSEPKKKRILCLAVCVCVDECVFADGWMCDIPWYLICKSLTTKPVGRF